MTRRGFPFIISGGMHRFYISESIPESGTFFVNDSRILHQCFRVLRLKSGEKIALFGGDGREMIVEIDVCDEKQMVVRVLSVDQPCRESNAFVSLYCAILKQDHFDLVVQKATELGVSRIIPIISKRTVKESVNQERLNRIAMEASEQSGRLFLPDIAEPTLFLPAIQDAVTQGPVLFYALESNTKPCFDTKNLKSSVFIGPEGGWDPEELQTARDLGASFCSLGSLTLRAETAAIVAAYLTCVRRENSSR